MDGGFAAQLAELYRMGGFVMLPLVGGAMLLWYAIGYRLLALRRGDRRPVRVQVRERQAGRGAEPKGIVDRAVALAVEITRSCSGGVRRRLDTAFFDLERDTQRYAVLIKAIVVVAPLLGLLGTVSGMIETFDSLGDMSLFSQSGGVAGGISEALFSTQMGLAVAIPGMLVGRVLARRQVLIELELQKVKNVICAEAAA